MQKILKSYLRRLNNLSGNNRSLQLLKLLKDQLIDIHEFDFINNQPSFEIIKSLISQDSRVLLCDEVDSRATHTNELSKRLKKIRRVERFIFEERGAKDLYVGWPFVQGKFLDDTPVRCPLLFFPVDLRLEDGKWYLYKRQDVNITFNKTFLLAYAYYNNTPLDEELVETVIDEYDNDSTVFRTQLYELLKDSGLELHFNQDTFTDQLSVFKQITRPSLTSSTQAGRLKLSMHAVLGIFPQSGSYLVPDYVKLIEDDENNDLESFFAKKTGEESKNQLALFDRVNEENTFTPFPLDAYQEQALKEIKKGRSIVVQGPPGTGKSQLISNLICDFIARGKKVLLVCQKRAALDVVYHRLQQKDMHDFVALVHDFKNDRKPIYEQIDKQIESIELYEKKNNSLDAIQLERNFLQASRRIDQILEELEDFREALFDESECGKSVKELYLISEPSQKRFSMNLEYRAFHYQNEEDTLRNFKKYLDNFHRFEQRSHFWSKGPSFANFTGKTLHEIRTLPRLVATFGRKIVEESKTFLSQPIDFDTAHYLSGKVSEIKTLQSGLAENVVYKVFGQLHQTRPTQDLNWLTQLERVITACFRGAGLESSLSSDQLGKFQEVLRSAMRARKSPFAWLKWRLFSKEKTFLKRVMVANELKSNKRGFKILVERIDNRLNFEHAFSQIKENEWLQNFPRVYRKIDIQDWFYWQKMGLNMYAVSVGIRSFSDYLDPIKLTHTRYRSCLVSLVDLLDGLDSQLKDWSSYLNIHQIRAIILEKEDPARLEKLLIKDFDAICAYHQLKESLSSEERKVLDESTEFSTKTEEAIEVFKNSLAFAWIEHIESKFPNLRSVSSGELASLTEELQEKITEKRRASKEILLLKSREKTYEKVEYNRLSNRITYRDLQHQVTKKRRIWPIRRLISEFNDELYALLPCWMCSPESASAIFPMQEQFDLVVFDEASQCFAERGIPAMYRGKQVVITGDSMQLQPSDLYRIRWEDDDDTPELSIDSLLNLAKHYLPEVQLSGHYRSKALELIDFSNEHFYKGKLRLLPDFEYAHGAESAISFTKVKGVWKDGINEIEGEKAVEIAIEFLSKYPEKEIGIITFNYRQQIFVQELLESKCAERNIEFESRLFVKNIENVQGDERDIVIFSITYAPDEKGVFKLQFGSLNVDGGENRLNVAITRAREKVVVIASVDAEEMQTDHSKNAGPKLLKRYLSYAKQVSEGKWNAHLPKYQDHHVDWYLRNKLQEPELHTFDEFTVAKELPFADLSVQKEGKYTGLILTDDERYYEALSPKQIYAFQHFHLLMKNWPHIRFHSREYWLDKEETKEKLRRFLFLNARKESPSDTFPATQEANS
ncbi:MAG: AAA domain-containing protein [Bacteroidota bacterium]